MGKIIFFMLIIVLNTRQFAFGSNFSDWRYRREIIIHNSSESLTNYQIPIIFSPTNFDYTKANKDGSDIRFTEEDGMTEISMWQENWDSKGYSKLWIKVLKIIEFGDIRIYMYYGNPNADSASNGRETFEVYEDFKTTLDNWTTSGNWFIAELPQFSKPDRHILEHGPAGSWDSEELRAPAIQKKDGRYYLYYEAYNPKNIWAIGLATSRDLKTWKKHPENPILTGTETWERDGLGDPSFLKVGATYYMYYENWPQYEDLPGGLGIATSTDLVHWEKNPNNPLLLSTDRWERWIFMGPTIIDDGSGLYRLLYDGQAYAEGPRNLGIATSNSFIDGWTKYKGNPIFTLPGQGSEGATYFVYKNKKYIMRTFWTGGDGRANIGLMTTDDFVNWKIIDSAVIWPTEPFEINDFGPDSGVGSPDVLIDGDIMKVVHEGRMKGHWAFCYSEVRIERPGELVSFMTADRHRWESNDIILKDYSDKNIAISVRIQFRELTSTADQLRAGIVSRKGKYFYNTFLERTYRGREGVYMECSRGKKNIGSSPENLYIGNGVWHKLEVCHFNDSYAVNIDDIKRINGIDNACGDSGQAGLRITVNGDPSSINVRFKDFFVRKYTDTEPTVRIMEEAKAP